MKCLLCNAPEGVVSAGFQQIYPQQGGEAVRLDWWECRTCGGWFVYPVPSPEMIGRYWETVMYNKQDYEDEIAAYKLPLLNHILDLLPSSAGCLLDVGSNFGAFLELARDRGWRAVGFEPNDEAVEATRARGFEVRSGWTLEEADFTPGSFDALVATDVFCYVWHPYQTLHTMLDLLKPGGTLVMRLTNKQTMMRIVRWLTPPGDQRNARLSRLLQAQFHTIRTDSLERICHQIGFTETQVHPRALASPLAVLDRSGQAMYLAGDVLYAVTLGRMNISPGVLFVARRGR